MLRLVESNADGARDRTHELLGRISEILAESRDVLADLTADSSPAMAASTASAAQQIVVRVIGFPVEVWQRSQAQCDEQLREFSLILLTSPDDRSHEVPGRLLDVIQSLTVAYAHVTALPAKARQRAADEGATVIDLEYRIPTAMADGLVSDVLRLAHMLDEADVYCRARSELLTVAAPPESVEFRRWLLAEFLAQLNGQPPVAWATRSPERSARLSTG